MRKHPLDLTSLLAGLVFIGLAAVYLLAAAGGNEVDASWVLPIALVALGLAGLVGGITRAVRGPADDAAAATASDSTDAAADTDDGRGDDTGADTDSGTDTDTDTKADGTTV